MRGKTIIGLGEACQQPVIEHRLRALQNLLGGLADQHDRARPAVAHRGERLRDTDR